MANVLIDNAVMADARTLAAQLAAKQEASLMGQYVKADGTVALTGEITVPTATSNPKAVNKGQMDAAIAAISAGGSADTVSVKGDYGAVGDGVADDTAEFQAAIASGKCLFIPEGTYKISSDLRIMTTRQSLIGVGWASKLVMTSSAKLILGEAIGSVTDGTAKTGTKPTNILLRDLWVQGQNNHVGAVIQIDFADAVKMFNVLSTISQYTNGSGAYAIGLKIRWCQWLDCIACYFMGNKYGIHMSIEYARHSMRATSPLSAVRSAVRRQWSLASATLLYARRCFATAPVRSTLCSITAISTTIRTPGTELRLPHRSAPTSRECCSRRRGQHVLHQRQAGHVQPLRV